MHLPTTLTHEARATKLLYIDLYPFRMTKNGIQFLLLKRRKGVPLAETWQAVSGKVQTDERIKDAFYRLSGLRTGVDAKLFFKVDYINSFYDADYDTILHVPVAACELDHDAKIVLSELHTDYKSATHDECMALLEWDKQKTSIQKIFETIKKPKAVDLRRF